MDCGRSPSQENQDSSILLQSIELSDCACLSTMIEDAIDSTRSTNREVSQANIDGENRQMDDDISDWTLESLLSVLDASEDTDDTDSFVMVSDEFSDDFSLSESDDLDSLEELLETSKDDISNMIEENINLSQSANTNNVRVDEMFDQISGNLQKRTQELLAANQPDPLTRQNVLRKIFEAENKCNEVIEHERS